MRWIAGDYVHVVEQDDWALGLGGGMRKARPKISATGRIVEDAVFDPLLIENSLEERNRLHLISGRIGRVDTQVVLHPGNGQVGILLFVGCGNSRGR